MEEKQPPGAVVPVQERDLLTQVPIFQNLIREVLIWILPQFWHLWLWLLGLNIFCLSSRPGGRLRAPLPNFLTKRQYSIEPWPIFVYFVESFGYCFMQIVFAESDSYVSHRAECDFFRTRLLARFDINWSAF